MTKHTVPVSSVPEAGARVFELDGVEVAVFRLGEIYRAVGNRCPHVQGPLALGRVENGEVICPWHGARFDLECGRPSWGPTKESIPVYEARRVGDQIEISLTTG